MSHPAVPVLPAIASSCRLTAHPPSHAAVSAAPLPASIVQLSHAALFIGAPVKQLDGPFLSGTGRAANIRTVRHMLILSKCHHMIWCTTSEVEMGMTHHTAILVPFEQDPASSAQQFRDVLHQALTCIMSWLAALAPGPKAPDDKPLMAQNSSRCSQTVRLPNRTLACGQYPMCCRACAAAWCTSCPMTEQLPLVGRKSPVSMPTAVVFPAAFTPLCHAASMLRIILPLGAGIKPGLAYF